MEVQLQSSTSSSSIPTPPVFPFRTGPKGWYGYIDSAGRVRIPAETSQIRSRWSDFYSELGAVRFEDGSVWVINTAGSKKFRVYPEDSDWNFVMRDGLMPNRDEQSGRWGYVNDRGEWKIKPQFRFAFPFSNGRARARVGDRTGVIDPDGRWIVQPTLDWPAEACEGLLLMRRGNRWVYLDESGRPAFGRDFEGASAFFNGVASVTEANKSALMDRYGRLLTPFEFDTIWPSDDGPFVIQKNGKWGAADASGQIVIPPQFYNMEPFSCGCSLVQDSIGLWFFVGPTGEKLFGTTFWKAERFVLDRAPVYREAGPHREWIDRSGKTVFRWTEPQFNSLMEQMR